MKTFTQETKSLIKSLTLPYPGIYDGNLAVLLKDGIESFPNMLKAISEAKKTINLEFYKIASDKLGWNFAHKLVERARNNVKVNFIYDAIGSMGCNPRLFQYLRGAGINLLPYRPIILWSPGWGINRRDHRKILIIDNKIGYTGGINLTMNYACKENGGKGWRDTHIRIEGPAVTGLQRIFLKTWVTHSKLAINVKDYLEEIKPLGKTRIKLVNNEELRTRRNIRRSYLNAIKKARKSIWIENAYFIPDKKIIRSIVKASKDGLDVRIILPQKSDVKIIYYASRRLFTKLLKAGVRIFEWKKGMMHSKTALIDETWSMVGSYNLDHRSYWHNLELNANILGSEFGKKMKSMLEGDFNSCIEVSYEKWKKRSLLHKVLERVGYLIRHWL